MDIAYTLMTLGFVKLAAVMVWHSDRVLTRRVESKAGMARYIAFYNMHQV